MVMMTVGIVAMKELGPAHKVNCLIVTSFFYEWVLTGVLMCAAHPSLSIEIIKRRNIGEGRYRKG